ncbi:MAG: Holliday junction branch migration protein RuvA [Gemmatimonadetes bacterium]|nr:Holliday junction branch migration protein RuvA [Gemmatimonadota bacterium]
MIAWIEGELAARELGRVVLAVGGMGFEIAVPLSTYELLPDAGHPARLLTHLHVREDELALFGFATADEKRVFETAIGVSGIGPKLALLLLSTLPVPRLVEAVRGGDLATLTRVPGVGRKTAERLVVELRDRFADMAFGETGPPAAAGATPAGRREEGAVKALVALGFPRGRAGEAVRAAAGEASDAEVEELVRRALGALNG